MKCKICEKHDEEAKRQVPAGWKEDDAAIWELCAVQSYTSAMGCLKEPAIKDHQNNKCESTQKPK